MADRSAIEWTEATWNARPGAGPVGPDAGAYPNARASLDLTGIDWLICGGESGLHARPMHPDWARELRDACLASRPRDIDGPIELPAFFFKQWGGRTPKANGRELDGRTWDEMPARAAVTA